MLRIEASDRLVTRRWENMSFQPTQKAHERLSELRIILPGVNNSELFYYVCCWPKEMQLGKRKEAMNTPLSNTTIRISYKHETGKIKQRSYLINHTNLELSAKTLILKEC